MKYQGLKDSEVLGLRKEFGENIFLEKEEKPLFYFSSFLAQFKNSLVYILLIFCKLSRKGARNKIVKFPKELIPLAVPPHFFKKVRRDEILLKYIYLL